MPPNRCDAVVIGADVEGLAAALTIALSGKRVVCVERHDSLDTVDGWDDAWASAAMVRALGLFDIGLRLTEPAAQLSLAGGNWRVLWPDAERSARALGGSQGDALLEFAMALQRWRGELSEPGAAARAMLSCFDLVRSNGGAPAELSAILRGSARSVVEAFVEDADLQGLILAMAAREAPVSVHALGSGPMLLALAPFFSAGRLAPRPVAGGKRALVTALATAFHAAGGELVLGQEVSEILMEREAATGVALGPGVTINAPIVIAAVAPKRLSQGLLNTRRYRRLLTGLRTAPRSAIAAMRLRLTQPAPLPESRLGLWAGGASVWLGATTANLQAAFSAMTAPRVHETPAVELRFSAGLQDVIAVSPYCASEFEDGPWTGPRRDGLRSALLDVIRTQWPQVHALIEEAHLLRPASAETVGATGALFGGARLSAGPEGQFALAGDSPGSLLKGVYHCVQRAIEPDCQAGILAASAAAGLSVARMRA